MQQHLGLFVVLIVLVVGLSWYWSKRQAPRPNNSSLYRTVISQQEGELLRFLRTFEALQEHLHLGKIRQHQQELSDTLGDLFPSLNAELGKLSVPPEWAAFHEKWREALAHLEEAYTAFLAGSADDFIVVYLQSCRALSMGKSVLYNLRAHLPTLQQYWVFPEVVPRLAELETPTDGVKVGTGLMHRLATDAHGEYALYVPENYDPRHRWPLIIALHGSHGHGDDYLLTWLRPAKSRGYLVLAPQSLGDTWSIDQPERDTQSVLAILDTVLDEYAIDTGRIFGTGLSDGGTFSYALGLYCPSLFAGVAPVAGVLPPSYDRTQAKTLPILIVHGTQDFIFPVHRARMAYEVLIRSAFTTVLYKELPDWGHAYPYSINESLVLPWFESLPARGQSARPLTLRSACFGLQSGGQ